MRVIIGWDSKEPEAGRVAAKSLKDVSGLEAEFLRAEDMRAKGLFTRLEDTRGQRFDLASGAPCSTEFSNLRFLVPLLGLQGPVLFVDCDVVFLTDPRKMLDERMSRVRDWQNFAVSVVQHNYRPHTLHKMVTQAQTVYSRKNWSSVMLFNCDHPANRRLTLWDVNNRLGRNLHNFYWLHDSEIGELTRGWNWLVGEQEKPDPLHIAHFTLGGPFTPGWHGAEHDDLWNAAAGK